MDQLSKIAEYANPDVLVTTEWLKNNLDNVIVVESDEDILLYETGHIPGAVKLDWHTELNHPLRRDYLESEEFATLMNIKGIGRQDSKSYPVVERHDSEIRAFRDEVLQHIGQPLVDVRSPEEYSGERLHMPDFPNEGATRGGHIPTAASIPWSKSIQEDETFRPVAELEKLYFENTGYDRNSNFIAYCRIGERSSHSWFVLKYLLGVENVRNYDGSWTEWGNLVGAPIATGSEPGISA
jgi:thiosulfate/3-mercaptopyruvate sulfurtransferase